MISANTKWVIFFLHFSIRYASIKILWYCWVAKFVFLVIRIYVSNFADFGLEVETLLKFYLIFFSNLWVFRFLFTINREFVKSEKIVSNSYLHFSLSWYNEKPSSRLPFHGRFSQFSCVFFQFSTPHIRAEPRFIREIIIFCTLLSISKQVTFWPRKKCLQGQPFWEYSQFCFPPPPNSLPSQFFFVYRIRNTKKMESEENSDTKSNVCDSCVGKRRRREAWKIDFQSRARAYFFEPS